MVEKALGFGSSYMVCISEYTFGNAYRINTVVDITFGTVDKFSNFPAPLILREINFGWFQ